jgi:hypothetical protein
VLAPPDIEARYGLLGGNIFQGDRAEHHMTDRAGDGNTPG